jgi:hypothetical protein
MYHTKNAIPSLGQGESGLDEEQRHQLTQSFTGTHWP